jgi:hypothetical protein
MEPPDRTERIMRFGCGALFGAACTAVGLFGCLPWPWWAVAAAVAMGWCGYAAMARGDRFWSEVDWRWPWWW